MDSHRPHTAVLPMRTVTMMFMWSATTKVITTMALVQWQDLETPMWSWGSAVGDPNHWCWYLFHMNQSTGLSAFLVEFQFIRSYWWAYLHSVYWWNTCTATSSCMQGSYYLDYSNVTYSDQSVLNVERHTYQILPCGYGSDTGGCKTDKILSYVVGRFGPVSSFSGSYRADDWTLNIVRGNTPSGLYMQWPV